MSEDFKERTEETYDIYLLPPGEDPKTCQSFLRMRNRDGKYYLTFEVWLLLLVHTIYIQFLCINTPYQIENRDGYGSMEVNVRFLGGLMALGYTVSAILERKSHIFDDDKVTVCEERLFRTTEPDIYCMFMQYLFLFARAGYSARIYYYRY